MPRRQFPRVNRDPPEPSPQSHPAEALASYYRSREQGLPFDREAFLARHPAAAVFIDRIEALEKKLASPTPRPSDTPEQTTLPPAPAGYKLLSELGRGGMGVVYEARQISLDRTVALKMVLGGGHATGDRVARLKGEAEAISRLQHPHIVQIHEVGEHNGLPFLCLEYLAGGTLTLRLAGGPLSPRPAADLLVALAGAVEAAHTAQIVHRDLKPANVLFTADGVPKVTDFGLAKQADSSLTSTGAVLGTASYMAPEQAEGRGQEVGPAADVYALGAILYECLTGRPPFRTPSVQETIRQVVHVDPAQPRFLNRAVPRELETVCLKCLAKDPRGRYASAGVLAADLTRWLRGEPVVARPTGLLGRGWRWCRRNPALAAAVVIAVVGLLTTAGVSVQGNCMRLPTISWCSSVCIWTRTPFACPIFLRPHPWRIRKSGSTMFRSTHPERCHGHHPATAGGRLRRTP